MGLDEMMIEVFFNLNDSMTPQGRHPWYPSRRGGGKVLLPSKCHRIGIHVEIHCSTKKRAGLLLGTSEHLMMLKEYFKCPLAASIALRFVSSMKHSNMYKTLMTICTSAE